MEPGHAVPGIPYHLRDLGVAAPRRRIPATMPSGRPCFMLVFLSMVNNLLQLYAVFSVMSVGITLGTVPILTKKVSHWFLSRRGLTLAVIGGAGSFGAMPATSAFLVLLAW